jgi:hypothetical protein
MGTRALTFVYNQRNKPIINLYSQYDGYPEGLGRTLAGFLEPLKVVNGLGRDTSGVANGMGCLAAQLVALLKTAPGGFYLESVTETDLGQDYEYHVYKDRVRVKRGSKQLFDGSWESFAVFCGASATA